MRMNFLNDALGRVPEYRAIENAVRQRKTPVAVTGLASIHKANILHTLLSAMSKKALFIAGDEAEATRMLEDLNAMGVTSAFYPCAISACATRRAARMNMSASASKH